MLKEPPKVCRIESEYMPRTPEKAERCRIGASCNPWRPCEGCPNYITERDRERAAELESLMKCVFFGVITPNEARERFFGSENER